MGKEIFKSYTCSNPRPQEKTTNRERLEQNAWEYIHAQNQTRCPELSKFPVQSRYFDLEEAQLPSPSTPLLVNGGSEPKLVTLKQGALLFDRKDLTRVVKHFVKKGRTD